jgi:hypothetical protein
VDGLSKKDNPKDSKYRDVLPPDPKLPNCGWLLSGVPSRAPIKEICEDPLYGDDGFDGCPPHAARSACMSPCAPLVTLGLSAPEKYSPSRAMFAKLELAARIVSSGAV